MLWAALTQLETQRVKKPAKGKTQQAVKAATKVVKENKRKVTAVLSDNAR
jgi:hypothetical protein